MGNKSSNKTTYEDKGISNEERRLYELQIEAEKAKQKEAKQANKAAARVEANRKSSYKEGLNPFYENLQSQLQRGTLDYSGASQQLTDYLAAGNITKRPQELFNNLQSSYNKLSDTRASTSVNRAYQTLLGRAPTAEEMAAGTSNLTGGLEGYSYDDLKDDIVNSKEYQDEYNRSYLDNYYDTTYGQQTRDEEGKRTGERTFDFSDAYMPKLDEGIAKSAGVETPSFGSFTGTVAELEEYQQGIRQARSFAYNAGLTNLQGDIDKEITKLKTGSAERIAGIQAESNILSGLTQGFFN